MTDSLDFEDWEVPDELKALDAELSSIRYEERPSFGPELRAELADEWATHDRVKPNRMPQLAAAAAVALLFVGTVVPSARASLVRMIGGVVAPEPVTVVPEGRLDAPAVMTVPIQVDELLVTPAIESPAPVATRPERPTASPAAVVVEGPAPTSAELADRDRARSLIEDAYPIDLQRQGVGGTARLMLFVDSLGSVEFSTLNRGTGIEGLDRAALAVAPSLRFVPATRRGRPVEMWVEFDVVFYPNPDEVDPFSLPAVDPVMAPEVDAPLDLALIPEWQGDVLPVAPLQREAGQLLEDVLDGEVVDRYGPVESILTGDPAPGSAPTQWRIEVGRALEEAAARAPDNPAPLLALARIRLKQGLRTDARLLLDRGLQRAMRVESGISPRLFAELHYQRGILIQESWLTHRGLGRLPGGLLDVTACPQSRSSGQAADGYASAERLIAWNYLCPGELGRVMGAGFEDLSDRYHADLAVMMASFRTAVEAQPDHVGANVEILLALADEGRWSETYDGARRFVRASMGHPYGLLLGGLALQRLSRSEEARDQFELALRGMGDSEVEGLQDLRHVISPEQRARYEAGDAEQRRAFERRFWTPLDPIRATVVNEREVEHLARAAYSHLRFGSTEGDASEVWIRYGRPVAVRTIGQSAGLRTELWDYGAGPDITFARVGTSRGLDLTPEGREYLDDLRKVFPHRYGSAGRTVFTLPAQVSRFRSARDGGWELEIHTEVPELLATGEADTLDVGVFMLDGEGRAVAVTRRQIHARRAPVTFRTPAEPTVQSVVVEVFNRATGQAAALREVVSTSPIGQPLDISDLMVIGGDPVAGNVSRDAGWIEPLTLVDAIDQSSVGVYFEVYQADEAAVAYRVRAEIEDLTTGEITVAPLRPAGAATFQAAWDRMPSDGPTTREFFTVSLADVPPGSDAVRVVVEPRDGAEPLVATRRIQRR